MHLLLKFTLLGAGLAAGAWANESAARANGPASPQGEAAAGDVPAAVGDPQRGYDLLVNTPYLPPDFSEEIFDNVWRVWPQPLRAQAAAATPQQRRVMAFERYGLTPRPETAGDAMPGDPLQYVVTAAGDSEPRQWTMNCFSCHAGTVDGQPYPGAPNNRFALQTMTEELRALKLQVGEPLSRMDLGSLIIPLGTTHGTTNAVVFGIGLMSRRDADLNVIGGLPKGLVHHDMDAPPWWHFHKRPYLYIDGFAERGHRGLMQFTLVPENGPQFYHDHEEDFRHIHAYLMSLRPPKYTGPIDTELAQRGAAVFAASCADCHGTYGEGGHYPSVRVPLSELGTDPVRLTALPPEGRQRYADSWFAIDPAGKRQQTVLEPDGYVAPPLDGVWASAPYFHNGSVPTLWHVLHPQERPTVWRRRGEALDHEKVGFQIETVDAVPADEPDIAVRRQYFDTRRFGKSNAGHEFPDALTPEEKSAVLEYLKTL